MIMSGTIHLEPKETGQFPIQTTLQLQASFIATLTGQLADPGVILLLLIPPNLPQQTLIFPTDLARTGVGVYTYTFTPTESGMWVGTWQGTGVVTATRDFTFVIQPSQNIAG